MTRSKTHQDIKGGAEDIALLILAASLLYGVSSGIRANYGVLLTLTSQSSGVDLASVSFVLAAAQLSFGIMQPVFSILAMRRSSSSVLRCGIGLMSAGLLSLPLCKSLWTLLTVLGLVLPSGTAALSFGIVMGVLTPKLPRRKIATASGVVTASAGMAAPCSRPSYRPFSPPWDCWGRRYS